MSNKRTRLTLATPEQVRRYIQRLMLQVENDEIDLGKARLLTNQAETVLKAILQKEQDAKVEELEQIIKDILEQEG